MIKYLFLSLSLLFVIPIPLSAQPTDNSAKIMILGTYHFANPGADEVNIKADDVLSKNRQAQIKSVLDSLSKFEPMKIAVEDPVYSEIDSLYQSFLTGDYKITRNEAQQLGFRLAKRFKHKTIFPIDHTGEFPFDEVMSYATKNDTGFIKYVQQWKQEMITTQDSLQENAAVAEILASLNSESFISQNETFYTKIATVGDSSNYVGADLVTAWEKRNLRIFANLENIVKSGDRIIVIFGAGHSYILRRLVKSSTEMELIEPNHYL